MNKKILILSFIFMNVCSFSYAGWESFDSSMLYSYCGYSSTWKPEDLLTPANDGWAHVQDHVHSLIVDIGYARDIRKFRFKNKGLTNSVPDDLDLYCSLDPNSWGSSISADIDISSMSSVEWTEVDTTDKTCRYIWFDIESTDNGSNYLGWGDDSAPYDEIIQFWEGDVDQARWTSYINLNNNIGTTSSTNYPASPTYVDGGIRWDGSKFSNIASAYLETAGYITGTCTPNTAPTGTARLIDVITSTEICTSTWNMSVSTVDRGSECSSNLPSGVSNLIVEFKNGCQTSTTLTGARLVLTQEAGDENYMRAYIPIGGEVDTRLTSYSRVGSAKGINTEKNYNWDADEWGTVTAAYYAATLSANNASATAYAKIDDVGASGGFGELSQTGTTIDLKISSDISSSLSDDTVYTSYMKMAGGRYIAYMKSAQLMVDLNPLTKYQAIYQFAGYGISDTTSGWIEADNHMQLYDDISDGNYFNAVTEGNPTYQTTIKHTGDTSMSGSLYDDGTRNSSADLTTTNTTFTWAESSGLTIADDSELTSGYNLGVSGTSKSGQYGDGKVLKNISGITVFGAMPERYVPRVMVY